MKALSILLASILLAAVGQTAFKHGMNRVELVGVRAVLRGMGKVFGDTFILAGLLAYSLSSLLWLYSMTNLDISFMYPLTSLSYLVTSVFALIFLKERITILRWFGLALVVTGSFLISST